MPQCPQQGARARIQFFEGGRVILEEKNILEEFSQEKIDLDSIKFEEIDFKDIEMSSGTLDLDFDTSNLNKFDLVKADNLENYSLRYRKPIFNINQVDTRFIIYDKAIELAKDIDLSENSRTYCVVSGNFIFGDLLEAITTDIENPINIKRLDINTLSLSQENIDSLFNIISFTDLKELNLIVSHYWFAHEDKKSQKYVNPDRVYLVDYLYEKLDMGDKLQVAIAGTHMKTCLLESHEGLKYVIHGSANLRSSANIEQFMFEENKELFDFNSTINKKILDKYYTIKKEIRCGALYKTITE